MKIAQNLIEYLLIFALVAVMSLVFVSKFDTEKLKNLVFSRPVANQTVTIEEMTP